MRYEVTPQSETIQTTPSIVARFGNAIVVSDDIKVNMERGMARKEAMRYVISQMEFPKKGSTGERLEPDPEVLSVIRNAEAADRYLKTHKEH